MIFKMPQLFLHAIRSFSHFLHPPITPAASLCRLPSSKGGESLVEFVLLAKVRCLEHREFPKKIPIHSSKDRVCDRYSDHSNRAAVTLEPFPRKGSTGEQPFLTHLLYPAFFDYRKAVCPDFSGIYVFFTAPNTDQELIAGSVV